MKTLDVEIVCFINYLTDLITWDSQLENRTLLTVDDVKINVKKERQKLAEKGSICIFLEGLCNCNKLKNLTTHLCRICVFFWEK